MTSLRAVTLGLAAIAASSAPAAAAICPNGGVPAFDGAWLEQALPALGVPVPRYDTTVRNSLWIYNNWVVCVSPGPAASPAAPTCPNGQPFSIQGVTGAALASELAQAGMTLPTSDPQKPQALWSNAGAACLSNGPIAVSAPHQPHPEHRRGRPT